jgi:SAM-dependent methyltransferase
MNTATLPSLPLIGPQERFTALRRALLAADFTERAVSERLGIKDIFGYWLEGASYFSEEPEDALGKLIRLTLDGGPVSRDRAPALPWAELDALGLVMPDPTEPSRWVATAMLYPVCGMYISSDRTRPVVAGTGKPPDDIVYPAIVPNTGLFLSLVPFTPCDAFLDLCAGTGVAALAAAHGGAGHAYSFDLTARCTHYAEFNRHLNGIANVSAAQGDLYEPAGDRTFDRIAAHPPYVPVYRPQFVFDSGGQDGEHIVRRIIQGLPRHLRPGGRSYILTMGTDREKPFEYRVREWLGDQEDEFDVAFVVRRVLAPKDYVSTAVVRYNGLVSDITAWQKFFEDLGVRSLSYGFLTIQRRVERRPVFTVRRQLGPRTGQAEHQWLMDWETSVARTGAGELLGARPRAAQDTRLRLKHRLEGDGWIPESYHLETEYPFSMELGAQAWTAFLLQRADGASTGAELLEIMKRENAVAADTPTQEFARMLALLVSGGFLTIP